MKRLLLFFSLFPYLVVGQMVYDFENDLTSDWEMSESLSWDTIHQNPLQGMASLKHVRDNLSSGHDQAAYKINLPDYTDTLSWEFTLKHGYNPSSTNKWGFYLLSTSGATQMFPTGNTTGFVIGVNLDASDDTLRLWIQTKNGLERICNTNLNWQTQIGTAMAARVTVKRNPNGVWAIYGHSLVMDYFSFNGEGYDPTHINARYGGIYFAYTASQDRQLWLDNIILNGKSIIDTIPPQIKSIQVIDEKSLTLNFTEPISEADLTYPENYIVSERLIPQLVKKVNDSEILLLFSECFLLDTTLILRAISLSDLNGNKSDSCLISFVFHKLKPNDIVITEIMADPSPAVGLPEFEFIELYNTSKFAISMNGLNICVNGIIKKLPNLDIDSHQHIILCHQQAADVFAAYGKSVGIFTSVYTIPNAGATIILKDSIMQVIDSLSFNQKWLKGEEKYDGGWSLEKIDYSRFCNPLNNWNASIHPQGGTPGNLNSLAKENEDKILPQIASISFRNGGTVVLQFSEEVKRPQNQSFIVNENIISDSLVHSGNSIYLYFNDFEKNVDYKLKVSDIVDKCSNMMLDTLLFFTLYDASPGDIVVNEIMADPNPSRGLPEYEFIELYNTSHKTLDLTGWTLKLGTKKYFFPARMVHSHGYLILACKESELEWKEYGDVCCLFSASSVLLNAGDSIILTDNSNKVIDALKYSVNWHNTNAKEGGYSLEKIVSTMSCNNQGNWKTSVNRIGGTPGAINSVNLSETKPIKIEGIKVNSESCLELTFSSIPEKMSVKKEHFSLNEGIFPDSIVLSENQFAIKCIFNKHPFKESNILHLQNIYDICFQFKLDTNLVFNWHKAKSWEIFITEVMADPDPSVQLPNCEYVELYNSSEYEVNLNTLYLELNSKSVRLPEYVLLPKAYVIITRDVCVNQFARENIIGFSSFPAIPNTGAVLAIKDCERQFLSGMQYNILENENQTKTEGGYSFEMIDITNPCHIRGNWQYSNAASGGTPGLANSVNTSNLILPYACSVQVVADSVLNVVYTQPVLANGALDVQNYSVNEGFPKPKKITSVDSLGCSFMVHFNAPFLKSISYFITISDRVQDCSGYSAATIQPILFVKPSKVDSLDVVINEILFNPLPGGSDFIEIFNKSNKTFYMNQFVFATRDPLTHKLVGKVYISESILFKPGNYAAFTTDPNWINSYYLSSVPDRVYKTRTLPSMNDANGNIVLCDTAFSIIDEVNYDEKMHFSLLTTKEGVSLERVSPNEASNSNSTWHSAAQLAGFATPGDKNSQYRELEQVDESILISPEVFTPDFDGIDDFVSIQYSLEKPGYVATIIVFDANGRAIKRLIVNKTMETNGVIIWDGVSDDNILVKKGIYLIYIELFHPQGDKKVIKKSLVRGGR